MQQLKIEMIHDLVCSWCPIGYRNIKQAIDILADQLSINLHFLPYELNPGTMTPTTVPYDGPNGTVTLIAADATPGAPAT